MEGAFHCQSLRSLSCLFTVHLQRGGAPDDVLRGEHEGAAALVLALGRDDLAASRQVTTLYNVGLVTLARASLAASASAAMALISCSGTRTSFTWTRGGQGRRPLGQRGMQSWTLSWAWPHLHPLYCHAPVQCALRQQILALLQEC